MYYSDIGHNKFVGVINLVHIKNNAFCYFLTCMGVIGGYAFYSAVAVIRNVVKCRDVHAVKVRNALQSFGAACPVLFTLGINGHNLVNQLLALAHHKKVNHISQRLGIIGAGSSGAHDRVVLAPVRA